MTITQPAPPFERDRFTWLAYVQLGYFSYMISALGPLLVFLAAELQLNYTVRGLHLSAFALGMVLAGATGDRMAHRVGRRRLFWFGGAGLALGTLGLLLAGRPEASVLSAFVMGLLGSYLLVMVQATLADHHGERRAVALTESNVGASAASLLVPVAISQAVIIGLGWRAAVVLGPIAWAFSAFFGRRLVIPAEETQTAQPGESRSRRLPGLFWLYFAVVLLGVSVEWCTVFWGAEYLERVVGMARVDAAAGMSAYFLAVVIARAVGSGLSRQYSSTALLALASTAALIGFPVFWLASTPILALTGLFLLGLGIANFFPLTLSAATGTAPWAANRASARVSLASGIAILVTPQILGSVADVIGIRSAFLIAGAVTIAVFVLTVTAFVRERRRRVALSQPVG